MNIVATLAEYEYEYEYELGERANAGVAAGRSGIRFGRTLSDQAVIADKLALTADA